MKYITRTIWILSLVSLLADVASEMLYPVMPLYLTSIGFSSVMIGLMEGVAEAVSGLSKGYFGRLSDAAGKRLPFVQLGYLLSNVSKSMMVLWPYTAWVFGTRAMDRLGKGLRTGARDAILSDETTPRYKGRVFGFHRALDTLGAAIGPLFALLYLMMQPGNYKSLFLLAFIPGMAAVALTFFVKEKKTVATGAVSFRLSQTFNYLRQSSANYRKMVGILLLFTLFNSSDIFLLMKIKASGFSDTYVIGAYVFYNLVYALAAFPLGQLGDHIGLKKTFALGLLVFAAVYLGFGLNSSLYGFVALFALYGIFAAATEGIAKALVSNLAPKQETASAIGTFAGLTSVVALVSSTLAGLLWNYISPETVFIFSAAGALLVIACLYLVHIPIKSTDGIPPPEATLRKEG